MSPQPYVKFAKVYTECFSKNQGILFSHWLPSNKVFISFFQYMPENYHVWHSIRHQNVSPVDHRENLTSLLDVSSRKAGLFHPGVSPSTCHRAWPEECALVGLIEWTKLPKRWFGERVSTPPRTAAPVRWARGVQQELTELGGGQCGLRYQKSPLGILAV